MTCAGCALPACVPNAGWRSGESIRHAVDPAAHRLPALANPVGVGRALVWITLMQLVALVLLIAPPLAAGLDALDPTGLRDLRRWTPPGMVLAAGACALAGLWAVWELWPGPGGRTVEPVRGLGRLALGTTLLGLLAVTWWALDRVATGPATAPSGWAPARELVLLGMIGAGTLGYRGLRDIFAVIGQRSREYRNAQGGRQRVRDLNVLLAVMAAAVAMRLVATFWPEAAGAARAFGTVVVWIAVCMLVIGQAYLVVNAWWIRRALRQPPPAVADLLGRSLPPPVRDVETRSDLRVEEGEGPFTERDDS